MEQQQEQTKGHHMLTRNMMSKLNQEWKVDEAMPAAKKFFQRNDMLVYKASKAVKKLVKHFESDSPDFDAADHAALNSGQTDPQYSYTMGTQVDQLVDNTLFPPAPTLFPTAKAKPPPEPTPIPTRQPTLAPSRAPTFSWGR